MGMNVGSQENLFNNLGYSKGLQDGIENALAANPSAVLSMLHGGFRPDAHNSVRPSSAGIPSFGQMPSPGMMKAIMIPICGAGYSGTFQKKNREPQAVDSRPKTLLNEEIKQAIKFKTFLMKNPAARETFEKSVGGRVLNVEKKSGLISIERFASGDRLAAHTKTNGMATNATASLGQMEKSVLLSMAHFAPDNQAAASLMAGSRFGVLALGGLGGMMSAGIGGSNLNLMNDGLASAQLGVNGFGALASLGGGGMGSWNPLAMPGRINNTNPIYEYAHQAQVAGVMMDPSLSVEDKVTLMLMLIMKKMDRDIARQAQYINSIQQQQSKNHGKGKAVGGPGGLLGLPLGGALGSKLGGATVGKLGGAAILKPNSIGKEIKKSFKGKTIKNRFKKVKKSLKGKNIKKKLRKKRNRLKKNPLKAIATGTGLVGGGALGGVLGGALGGVPGKLGGLPSAAPSIDVETMKLKRMIDKRGQMFDMLRQIIDKYNETAKGLIQSMGR